MDDREWVGCQAGPAGCSLGARALHSWGVGVAVERNFDPAPRVVGRTRHRRTDVDSRRRVAAVSATGLHAATAACTPTRLAPAVAVPAGCLAARALQGKRAGTASVISVEIVEPQDWPKGFAVQPERRDIVRTFD